MSASLTLRQTNNNNNHITVRMTNEEIRYEFQCESKKQKIAGAALILMRTGVLCLSIFMNIDQVICGSRRTITLINFSRCTNTRALLCVCSKHKEYFKKRESPSEHISWIGAVSVNTPIIRSVVRNAILNQFHSFQSVSWKIHISFKRSQVFRMNIFFLSTRSLTFPIEFVAQKYKKNYNAS